MCHRSGHLWDLLDCERERSHLFVPMQGCKLSGRVRREVEHVVRVRHHPCSPSSRAKAAGQIVVVLYRQANLTQYYGSRRA